MEEDGDGRCWKTKLKRTRKDRRLADTLSSLVDHWLELGSLSQGKQVLLPQVSGLNKIVIYNIKFELAFVIISSRIIRIKFNCLVVTCNCICVLP